ncbi:MAG: thioredoxin fold domain-containing protein [Sulfitobacter sp.]|nr:thioredoxin fold domain-containing protein [Sulfitobacter sp.]
MNRRRFLSLSTTSALGLTLSRPNTATAAEMSDSGLFVQSFFLDSFLELGDDLGEAAAANKGLIVIFEQRGCPYCRELHEVNFARSEIVEFMSANFDVVQLDLWGARPVVDFDGEELEERDLARKWFVNFTPTQIFFPGERAGAADIREAEVFRLPGYFKPFHHLSGLEYVATGAYKEQPFQRYLQDKFELLRENGIDPDVW